MTGISTFGQALGQIKLLNDQNLLLSRLTRQLSSQQKTDAFSGLGTEALTSERSRANIQSIDAYTNNIIHADRRIKSMLNAIEEFQAQVRVFEETLIGFSQQSVHQQGDKIIYDDPTTLAVEEATEVGMTSAEPDVSFSTLQDLATNIFGFMVDLVNTKEGDRFLLGGADTQTQPLVDGGTLDAAISTLIKNWKDETLPAATNLTSNELVSALRSRTVADDPNAVTDTVVGYSAALSANNVGNIFIRVDDNSEIEYTALANEKPFRDILVSIAYIKNPDLAPIADVYAEPYTAGDPTLADGAPGATLQEMKDNFFQVYNAISGMVNKALDEIDQIRFKLENARARIDTIRKNHEEQKNALLNTVSDVEHVDVNEVALQIQTLQIQLESSYRVTALLSELSLARFL